MKKFGIKQLPIQRKTRSFTLFLISTVILVSFTMTAITYQTPETSTTSVVTYPYTQQGLFDFTIFLKNNTVYNNKSFIKPEQEIIFRKMIDSMQGSYEYTFQANKSTTFDGKYQIESVLKTNLWKKTYTTVSQQHFSTSNKTLHFTFNFPVNLNNYENVIQEINEEIDIRAQDPKLIITFNIFITAETPKDTIHETFSQSVNLSIGDSILEFSKNLSQTEKNHLTEDKEVINQSVKDNKIIWSLVTTISIISLVILIAFSRNNDSNDEKRNFIKKLKKKYDQWIIEIDTLPRNVQYSEKIEVNSIEDINKLGEDLGKPLLYYKSKHQKETKHSFLIIDGSTVYEYNLE